MNRIKSSLIALILLIAGVSSQGQAFKFYFPPVDWKSGWAAGLKAGTLGPGVEGIKSINPNWNARVGFSYLPLPVNRSVTVGELGLDIQMKNRLGGVNLQGDFFFKPWFYFTGGLLVDLVRSRMVISLTDTVNYGDIQILPDAVGKVTARVRPGWAVAPFLGIGLGNPMPLNRKFWFNVELGALYHGKPRFSLVGEGMVEPTASVENEAALEAAFKGYRFYPMCSVQVSYRIR